MTNTNMNANLSTLTARAYNAIYEGKSRNAEQIRNAGTFYGALEIADEAEKTKVLTALAEKAERGNAARQQAIQEARRKACSGMTNATMRAAFKRAMGG